MRNDMNIINKINAIFVILLLLLCSNIVFAPNAAADDYGYIYGNEDQDAWSKIQQDTRPVILDINKAYTLASSDYRKKRKELGKLKTWSNPCQTGLVDIIYSGGCHSCKVLKILMSSFINGCSVLEGVSKSAGTTILLLCSMLWIAFFILQQLGSLKNIEPMSMLNNLLTMCFKVLCTYLVIQFGFALFLNYIIVPILQWGVDFGSIMLDATVESVGLNNTGAVVKPAEIMPDSKNFLPGSLLNGMMEYVAKIDSTITNHMKMGHMIACHARHKGQWTFMAKIIRITNFGTLLCGILIWMFAFVMAYAIVFYLFDSAIKLAVALLLLPILAAFWPFGALRDKSMACLKMILNAAALFVFLSLTSSLGLVLVDKSVQIGEISRLELDEKSVLQPEAEGTGMKALMTDIEKGNSDAVTERFSFASLAFLVLVFTYIYAIKLIGSTIPDYVDKFFADSLTGKIHDLNKRMGGWAGVAGQRAKEVTKGVGKAAGGKAEEMLHKGGRAIIDKIKPANLDNNG